MKKTLKIKKDVPLVSICLPNYNSEKFIYKTVISLLNQSYKNIEIIVVDNFSTDDSIKILERFDDSRLKIYRNKSNIGYSRNVNKSINLANGEYVAVYHSDDIYDEHIVKKQVSVLNKCPDVAGVFSLASVIDESDKIIKKNPLPFDYNKKVFIGSKNEFFPYLLRFDNFIVCPTSMIRKKVYDEVGIYNPDIKVVEDQEMWLRILNNHNIAIINEYLINYRIHKNQGSSKYNNLRDSLHPKYLLFDKYIKNDFSEINKGTLEVYNKRKARDYLFYSISSMLKNNKIKLNENLLNSKKFFRFSIFSFYGLIYFLMSSKIQFILRPIVSFIFKMLKFFKLENKINFVKYV